MSDKADIRSSDERRAGCYDGSREVWGRHSTFALLTSGHPHAGGRAA